MPSTKTKRLPLLFFTCGTALLSPALTNAGAGDGATNYGLGPMNAGTALAFSPFASNSWSVYYNPAAMAGSPEGELSAIVQYGDQDLRAKSLGGAAPLARENDVLSDTSSELLLIGFKSRIAGISSIDKPIYFGLNVGVDEYSSNLLPYQANTSQEGQFLRYESQPLYLAFGGAISNILRGVDVGASARLTLEAKANLETVSDLGGNTDSEKLSLEASPSLSPALGINIRSGEFFCGTSQCMPFGMDKLEFALFWRGESSYEVSVDANVVVPGVIPEPGLSLALSTIDTYQPEVLGAAFLLPVGQFELTAGIEQHKWSALGREFASDTVRDQANLAFDDITIPRIGISYQWSESMKLFAGAALEESPLKSTRSQDVNYLDTDKKVFGLGASYRIASAPVINMPLEVAFAYQYQMLDEADFELTSINAPTDPAPFETVRADGEINVFSSSLSLKF
ncbi:OmpP1/FadL family transporter [Alcanivorax jadensis]|jgi:outer membrane protein transport protein (OMPP1/FadL/TodX)|uniref:OmpP1/FadL family transporter n=1 Tax=Alcanivorax jadensis TaxID=64988 RepID=UPI002409D9EC|nr:outer membrane protein transport protein [Alcanivorax jadensis]MDF1636045.1 outer membrane protein transport protein [Alcanivorax jadensis]|tara:strand:+ start:589 stop:1950 length:1362 start_codon:yes stop_codon:yes gene_type:complete